MSFDLQSPTAERLRFQTALAGRYSIERELGRGGMGVVFLAREVALDRLVALKLLPPAMAARPGVKDRFLREARTAARLSHPNIVQIYSVDEVDDFVFFAMAYVDGGTLGERIRERGPLSNSEAVRLLREVAWALGHAHLQGVVHRDVKPDNILMDQESGRAMVTDFGIALAGTDTGDEGEGATQVVGTAEFISPEQAKGAPVDARSDLYSLACVGFYALSGRVPFTADSAAAILVKHVTATPPTVLSAAPHAPPLVASALDRCLRKDPEQRFTRGDALADALGPQEQTGEMALPLRVFIKQSREWETTLAYTLLTLSFAVPGLIASASLSVPFLATAVMVAVVLGLLAIPPLALVRITRRLLKSGFTQADGTVAFLKDIDRKEEEYRFEVGERVTFLDRAFRVLKLAGFAGAPLLLATAIVTRSVDLLLPSMLSLDAGILGTIFQELRARARGDVVGERFLRLWKSRLGKKLFQLGGLGLERVAPALSPGIHRPTEVVIGLEADRLFEALPKDVKRSLEGLPTTVQALEKDAQALRKQVAEMDAILAEIGDDDPSHPSSAERARVRADVTATRGAVQERLRKAVAALETIRLGLLYMQAGSGGVESLTMELKSAQEISNEMENLLAGHREVERILRERRETGVFRLVDGDTPGGD